MAVDTKWFGWVEWRFCVMWCEFRVFVCGICVCMGLMILLGWDDECWDGLGSGWSMGLHGT